MSSEPVKMSPATAPLDDDDLLSEILLRLPPQPSSLPRASAVCKRWRCLVSDPAFSRRFRRHHRRNPPLLGCFHGSFDVLWFEPTPETPNRVPPSRFSLQLDDGFCSILPLGCRHGFVLLMDHDRKQVLVWCPFTGDHRRIAVPPGFDPTKAMVNGAVLGSATGDLQHFKVILAVADNNDELNSQILVCVYSSETGVWGNLISTPIPFGTQVYAQPAMLLGHSLNWLLVGGSLRVLEFDLERQRLAVVQIPISDYYYYSFTVMRAEDGGLAFLSVSGFTAELWKRKTDSDGVASWVMGTTIELDKLLSLDSNGHPATTHPRIQGFAEDNNLVFLSTLSRLFTLQVEPLQFKELRKPRILYYYHPFESVYAAGI